MIMLLYGFIMLSENGFIIRDLSLITGKGAASTTRYRVCVCGGGGGGQGGNSTPSYPGCVCSNWREMGPFWTWREGNGVLLYGYISRVYTCMGVFL